jgi:Sulfotransferase family
VGSNPTLSAESSDATCTWADPVNAGRGGDDFPRPIFVGGSARSGTHALGRLIGAHPRYHLVEVEARFHSAHGGLCDLLNGATELDAFKRRCRGAWWQRGLRQRLGLRRIVEPAELDAALERFSEELESDPWAAGRRLVVALLDPPAKRAGKPAWVEVTGSNIRNAPTLLRLFPRARFVHMARDGRAVTAAILRKRDMTDDVATAFAHWVRRVRRSDAALRRMPPGSALTIFLDDLAAHDREDSYAHLVEFLELDNDAPMRRYFDETISPDRAHVGRWRERIAPADARWVDRRYRKLVHDLRREGITWIPKPERRRLRR